MKKSNIQDKIERLGLLFEQGCLDLDLDIVFFECLDYRLKQETEDFKFNLQIESVLSDQDFMKVIHILIKESGAENISPSILKKIFQGIKKPNPHSKDLAKERRIYFYAKEVVLGMNEEALKKLIHKFVRTIYLVTFVPKHEELERLEDLEYWVEKARDFLPFLISILKEQIICVYGE